jgi:hypothetical protein
LGVAVGTATEVAVERGDDGVLAVVVVGVAFPLSDAGAAGVGHDHGPDLLEVVEQAVALGRVPDLLGAGVDDELRLHLDVFLGSLTGNRGGACRSWYDELVHDPTSPTSMVIG